MQLGMEAAGSWQSLQRKLAEDLEIQIAKFGLAFDVARMVGMLFARPSSKLSREDVIPNMPYFHERSAAFINFYCVGYSDCPDVEKDEELVLELNGKEWVFSNSRFNRMRERLESISRWKYSGSVELILTNARLRNRKEADLDLSSAICANLAEMKQIGAIANVETFIEKVIRYAEKPSSIDPTWGFSDKAGVDVAGSAFRSLIVSLLPESLREDVKRAVHFAVSDISTGRAAQGPR